MKIRVLFIPHEIPSHAIPLLSLANKLNVKDFEYSFFLPKGLKEDAELLNINFLDIDNEYEEGLLSEMQAFSSFNPDVVVDDLSFSTGFSTRLLEIPRVSILRKGIFLHDNYNDEFKHSSSVVKWLKRLKELNISSHGLWEPQSIPELFVGDMNIIPSIPSVEVLPPKIKSNKIYQYSGPLIIGDQVRPNDVERIKDFIKKNNDKKIVYFTGGIVNHEMDFEVQRRLTDCIKVVLDKGAVIITNLIDIVDKHFNGTDLYSNKIFCMGHLPMHLICSKVDVMVHHCGSGAYNYQLKYQLPSVIFGSARYDRDEVGARLDELGAAEFLPANLNEDAYYQKFDSVITALLDSNSELTKKQRRSLSKLFIELEMVENKFDFGKLLKDLLSSIEK